MADAMNLDTGTPAGVADKGSADTSKATLPGYTGQFDKEAAADLQSRISKDPKFIEKLPKGLSEMYRSYATSLDLADRVTVPDKNAPKEAWDRYYKSIGRPDGPDGYQFRKPTNLPDGLPYSDELAGWFAKEMFDAGVPTDVAQRIFANWNKRQSETFTANVKARDDATKAAIKAGEETLRAEFKDAYPAKIEAVKTAMTAFMTLGLLKKIEGARTADGVSLANDPDFVKAWASVGERMAPDKIVTGAGGAGATKQVPVGAARSPGGVPWVYPSMAEDPQWKVKAE